MIVINIKEHSYDVLDSSEEIPMDQSSLRKTIANGALSIFNFRLVNSLHSGEY